MTEEHPAPYRISRLRGSDLILLICLQVGCNLGRTPVVPAVSFTSVPAFGEGRADQVLAIAGAVAGAMPGQRIVIYAKSGVWWVQPRVAAPFTAIQAAKSTWKNETHPGSAYAALLVGEGYRPPATIETLPEKGGPIAAVAIVGDTKPRTKIRKSLQFAGYDWLVRDTPNLTAGARNQYEAANAWTDRQGFLHLCIQGTPGHWTSAELSLPRSLGYGSYRFAVRDVAHLEPSVVFNMLTWDEKVPTQEMDIEISRWGQPSIQNGQFVIQPYFVPANTTRFQTPPGPVTFQMRWSPGRASFEVFRGTATQVAAMHTFTSGVPPPGRDSIHLNLYVFGNNEYPLKHPAEVIVENFEYLP